MDKVLAKIQAFPTSFGQPKLGALLIVLAFSALLLALFTAALRHYRSDHYLLHAALGGLVGAGNFFMVVKMEGLKLAGTLNFWWAVAICALAGAVFGLLTKFIFEAWDLEDLFDDGIKAILLAAAMAFLLFVIQLAMVNYDPVRTSLG